MPNALKKCGFPKILKTSPEICSLPSTSTYFFLTVVKTKAHNLRISPLFLSDNFLLMNYSPFQIFQVFSGSSV